MTKRVSCERAGKNSGETVDYFHGPSLIRSKPKKQINSRAQAFLLKGYLEARRQASEESDTDTEANEGGHGAMWDGGGELDQDTVVLIRDLDMVPLGHIQLLQ